MPLEQLCTKAQKISQKKYPDVPALAFLSPSTAPLSSTRSVPLGLPPPLPKESCICTAYSNTAIQPRLQTFYKGSILWRLILHIFQSLLVNTGLEEWPPKAFPWY